MFKIFLNALIIIQLMSSILLVWILGFFVISFPKYNFETTFQYFGILVIITGVSHIVLGVTVYVDFKKRIWISDIKRNLWKKIFLWGFFNRGIAVAVLVYYLAVTRGSLKVRHHAEGRKYIFLHQILSRKAILDPWSKISAVYIPLFSCILFLVFIGAAFNSIHFMLLGFKLSGIWIIAILPTSVLFQYLMITHMVLREWSDYSFERYFNKWILFLPGLEYTNYYKEVVKKELN